MVGRKTCVSSREYRELEDSMGRKAVLDSDARIRRSFDLTPKAWENLNKHGQVTGMPLVAIINDILENAVPIWTKKATAHAKTAKP